jgi:hypothetical protein
MAANFTFWEEHHPDPPTITAVRAPIRMQPCAAVAAVNPAHLFHASEEHDIASFHPRPPPSPEVGPDYDCVWAIGHDCLSNYLAPRDCPRVIVRCGDHTSAADKARFIGDSDASAIMTIERGWFAAMNETMLTVYAFDAGPHWLSFDASAGYYLSPRSVTPVARHRIADPAAALAAHHTELRVVDNLWPLIDAVVASTMRFSIIRKRNAQPR